MKKLIMTVMAAMGMVACGNQAQTQQNGLANGQQVSEQTCKESIDKALLEGEWKVVKIGELEVGSVEGVEEEAMLGFDLKENRVWGSTSCNKITGALVASDGELDFSQTGTTRMMCANMDVEMKFLGALANVKKFGVDGNVLLLKDSEGVVVVVLEKK